MRLSFLPAMFCAVVAHGFEMSEDFSVSSPDGGAYGIVVERGSNLSHGHGWVEDGAYRIPVDGSRHFLAAPPLGDFNLELDYALGLPPRKVLTIGVVVFFRYDRATRSGHRLEVYQDCRSAKAHVRIDGREIFSPQEDELKTDDLRLVLNVSGEKGRLEAFGEKMEFDVPAGGHEKGLIGFDQALSESGKLFLRRASLSSHENPSRKKIGSWRFALGCDQGLVSPPVYDVAAWRYETGETQVDCVLSGLLPDRPPREASGGGEWASLVDRVTEPYVRIIGADGSERTILFWNGRREFRDPLMGHKPPVAWPARAMAVYWDFPEDFAVAAGYERAVNNPWRFAGDGPREQLQSRDGTLLREGQAVRPGRIAFKAASPADKKIVGRIPADLPERERALRHVRKGHYFLESETPRFTIETTWRKSDYAAEEIVVLPRLESVYGDAVDVDVAPDGDAPVEEIGAGLVRRRRTFAFARNPGVGVWHLETEVGAGAGSPSRTERTVFEVLSDDPNGPCPPLVSGLPELVSMPNEVKYLEESAFDPWSELGGVSHYYAIDMRYPKVAARMRTWEADHVYRRKLFTWVWPRNAAAGDCDPEGEFFRSLIRHADYFGGDPKGKHVEGRIDFALGRMYTGMQMDFLNEYLAEKSVRLKILTPEAVAKHRANNSGLTEDELKELYDTCWDDFKRWGNDRARKAIREFDEYLLSVNPKIARAGYGPMPVYVSHYKSPYTLEYDSNPLDSDPRIRANGSFWLFEDYHYSCDYPLSRPAYFVAGYCLLHSESRRIFPEIYYEGWSRCLDGAVYRAHPDKYPRLAFTHQRRVAYQYVYGTPFMRNDGSFGFWRDYGFHARNPEKEAMDEFLHAWRRVVKNPPAAPLKAPFVFADPGAIRRHGDFLEADGCMAYLGCGWNDRRADVNNTAEEDGGYSYERICAEGYVSPVVATLGALDHISGKNCEFAVLPPLVKGTPGEVLDAVRRAHGRGVNMMCFEEAAGLEDLFDVSGAMEFARRETACGRTVFVKTPPTMVERDAFLSRYSRGRDTTSRRMDAAMRDAFAYLAPCPAVRTGHGDVMAVRTAKGNVVVVLSEASPLYRDVAEYPVTFRFAVSASGIGDMKIDADAPYSVVEREADRLTVRTTTEKDTALFFRWK